MHYPTHDTDWAISSKGNYWKRKDGTALVAGQRKDCRYWARRGGDYLQGFFLSLEEAKSALEDDSSDEDVGWYDDDRY
jgi:hypothetical protein